MISFEFATAGRIVFGPGSAAAVPRAAAAMGRRVLLVTGRSHQRSRALAAGLREAGMEVTGFAVDGEPTVELVRAGVAAAREAGCAVVVACGGGSAIDGAKAIAVLLANGGDPLDYLEVVGLGKPLERPSAPFIAVPTTAGTGSEVTRNAVLGSPEHGVKASLRSPHMLARLAVIDPDLTLGLPPDITASTGLDALTQLIEPYVSVRANAMTDMFCRDGMRRAARFLARACRDGHDREARTQMSMASLLGGLSLANAGLGVVHGFAAPVGGMFPAPHGAVCAALLPHGMEANIRALRARAPESEALRRYEEIAGTFTGNPAGAPEDGVAWVAATCRELGIPGLRRWGVREAHIPDLAEKASAASSMKGNPLPLTREELERVLSAAL